MDDSSKPVPINTDLADDHYDHEDKPKELVHGEPEVGDVPSTTATSPEAVKKAPEA